VNDFTRFGFECCESLFQTAATGNVGRLGAVLGLWFAQDIGGVVFNGENAAKRILENLPGTCVGSVVKARLGDTDAGAEAPSPLWSQPKSLAGGSRQFSDKL
jgi:hypothetical protein